MYRFIFYFLLSLLFTYNVNAQFVDDSTLENVQPVLNTPIENDWQLEFSDEFAGTTINPSKWNVNVSTKSRAARPKLSISDWWWKEDNVWQENGNLVLEVEKHDHNTMHCGSVNSNNLYETTYGYFEVRLKIADASKGTHTAFWFQGDNMGNVDDTANDGAEIDVFESAWLGDYTKSVIHIDGYGANHHANTKKYDTPGIHEGYHVWGLHWTEDFMKIYYDGELKVTYSDPKWVVQSPEYLWLSDGASFGIEGDYFTREPNGTLTHAYVDYVRVWKSAEQTDNLVKNGDFETAANTSWSKNNSDIVLNETAYPVYESSAYCRMPGIPGERYITQDIEVEPGFDYKLQFSGRVQNSHAISDVNNHSVNGPATLKCEILNGSDELLGLSTQSNTNTTLNGVVSIPEGVNQITLKLGKNWNVAYVDQIELVKTGITALADGNKTIESLRIYPNPTSGVVRVSADQRLSEIQVCNMAGRNIYTIKNINASSTQFSLSNYDTGMYVLKVISEDMACEMKKLMLK